jgi:hypothetical protein
MQNARERAGCPLQPFAQPKAGTADRIHGGRSGGCDEVCQSRLQRQVPPARNWPGSPQARAVVTLLLLLDAACHCRCLLLRYEIRDMMLSMGRGAGKI